VDLLFYPVIVAALLLPAAWLWHRGEPPLEAITHGAAFGALFWGGVALLRFLLVLRGGVARDAGLIGLALSTCLAGVMWWLTRRPTPGPRLRVPASTWAPIGGCAVFLLGFEAALPHFGVIQWSFDWWMHFDLARFYLHPVNLWRVYPGGDVISARTPLYNLLGSLTLATLGDRFSIMQVFSAAVGWLWILPAALLSRRHLGMRGTVLALLAVSPLLAFSNAYVWPKGLVLFFLLLALERVLALRAVRAAGAGHVALQAGLAIGGALMAHVGFAGYLLPLLAVVAWDGWARRELRRFACLLAGTGLVVVPWYCWSVAEYGWQRGLFGYYHAQAGSADLVGFAVQRLVILVTGVVPVTPRDLGFAQDYFLIYLGSAAGLAGLVFMTWTAARWLRHRDALPDGWNVAVWFAASGALTAALLCRQYAVAGAGALFTPALIVLIQLAAGSRKIPALVILVAGLEMAVFETILLLWMWSPASAGQPNAQLALDQHIEFLGRSTLPAGIVLMLIGAAACIPALGLRLPAGIRNRSTPDAAAA
jgi:hypothetical protein